MQLTLEKLIKVASKAYPDGLVERYFKDPHGTYGDTLAKFVACELAECFDYLTERPKEMGRKISDSDTLQNAANTIKTAVTELESVVGALERESHRLWKKERKEAAPCAKS